MSTPANPPDPPPASPAPAPSLPPAPTPAVPPAQRAEDAEAVAALQNLAKPQPKPVAPELRSPAPPDLGPSSGASGFVAMLARGQIGRPPGPRKHPPERKAAPAEAAAEPEAHAVPHELLAAVAASARSGRRRSAAIPRWYRVAGPVLFTLAGLLIVICVWAGGALIYMAHITPAAADDMHYPLITWSEGVGESGGYTEGSHLMAWLMMLACPPVAVILGASGLMIRRHMRAPATAAGAARA